MDWEKCIDDGLFSSEVLTAVMLDLKIRYRFELVLLADSKAPDERSGDHHYLLTGIVVIGFKTFVH